MSDLDHDPNITAMRGEYVIAALEGAHSQAQGVVRFLLLGDHKYAIAAWDRMLGFIREAAPEMKEIRAAAIGELLFADAAADYRDQRSSVVQPRSKNASA